MACTGASIPVCTAAAGVTPNTLKSWLRRKDHEAFLAFQRYFAEAVTYATLAILKTIMEGVAADPKHAKAHYMMGLVYANAGDVAKARQYLTEFVQMAPNDPDAPTAKEMIKSLD